jgi:hypothetical protein
VTRYRRERHGFCLTCWHCTADHNSSIAEANALGWTQIELFHDFAKESAFWTHIGVCPHPECKAEQVRQCG